MAASRALRPHSSDPATRTTTPMRISHTQPRTPLRCGRPPCGTGAGFGRTTGGLADWGRGGGGGGGRSRRVFGQGCADGRDSTFVATRVGDHFGIFGVFGVLDAFGDLPS